MNKKPSKEDIAMMGRVRRSWSWAMAKAVLPQQRRNRVLAALAADVAMGKTSYHSSMGSTLAPIISFLEDQKIPYILKATPGKGYEIQGFPPKEEAHSSESELTTTSK